MRYALKLTKEEARELFQLVRDFGGDMLFLLHASREPHHPADRALSLLMHAAGEKVPPRAADFIAARCGPAHEATATATLVLATVEVEDNEGDALDFDRLRDVLAEAGVEVRTHAPGARLLARSTLRRAQEAMEAAVAMLEPHVSPAPLDPERVREVLRTARSADELVILTGAEAHEDGPHMVTRVLWEELRKHTHAGLLDRLVCERCDAHFDVASGHRPKHCPACRSDEEDEE